MATKKKAEEVEVREKFAVVRQNVDHHHDGHGLAESLEIKRIGGISGGGAFNSYEIWCHPKDGRASRVGTIQYQDGPRDEPGSIPGALDSCLLAIVADRMEHFQAGPFACDANGEVADLCGKALDALRKRADERAGRGVLGKNKK